MHKPTIAVINESTVCDDADVQKWTTAVQVQVVRDFAPLWKADATIIFVPKGQRPTKHDWWAAILDDSDQAGALGYHDMTNHGLPLAKVFAKTTLQYGDEVSVVLSHEILEMLGDPHINQVVQGMYQGQRVNWVKEACDAVESDEFGYLIDDVRVSDFVTLDYFNQHSSGAKYDFGDHLSGPVPDMTSGGYMSYENNLGWHQIYGDQAKLSVAALYKGRPLMGSRRYRRMIGRENFMCSTVDGIK